MSASPSTTTLGPRTEARKEEFLERAARIKASPRAELILGTTGSGRVVPRFGNTGLNPRMSEELAGNAQKLAQVVAKLER